MMAQTGLRQLEERHVAVQVDLIAWCQKLDLLALSNFKGEVQVHRLHWQKVWTLSPPKEGDKVTGLVWRPDEKALAVGYSSGRVLIVNVEDKKILHCFDVPVEDEKGVTYLNWAVRNGLLNSSEYNIYEDSSIYLPKPPSLNAGYKNKSHDVEPTEYEELQEQTQLDILIVAFGNGKIHLSVFGKFSCGFINLIDLIGDKYADYKIVDAGFSPDFSIMQVFYIEEGRNSLQVALVYTTVLSVYSDELFSIAKKHCQIGYYLNYVEQTMTSITEAWEHIVLEMDAKMADYAAAVQPGGVSADLLDLLMLGVASDELELYLLQDLSVKGLKKFSSSIELSYSTIQKLVLKQLNIAGQSLTYVLAELRGLARIPDRYKVLGLEEATVTEAIHASAAFLNKCLELQQVIDVSMRNYKVFFRWLFVVLVRLLNEVALTEIIKMTQQDLTHIAEFLYNFDSVDDTAESNAKRPVRFNLERLAQYLKDQELTILPDDDENQWQKFIKENPCILKESETIIPMSKYQKFSLVMQQNHLNQMTNNIFEETVKSIGSNFYLIENLICYDEEVFGQNPESYRLSQAYLENKTSLIAITHLPTASEGFYFISINFNSREPIIRGAKFKFLPDETYKVENLNGQNMLVQDVKFYSEFYLFVLLSHPNDEETSALVLFPIKLALNHCQEISKGTGSSGFVRNAPTVETSDILHESLFNILEKMPSNKMSVSGGRKVSAVITKSCRKVRILEMEVDQEDNDSLDTTPLSQGTNQQSDTSINASGQDNSAFEQSPSKMNAEAIDEQ